MSSCRGRMKRASSCSPESRWTDVATRSHSAIRCYGSTPAAQRGSQWFLGPIYGYYEEGIYFGVPLANFVGWAVVGAVLVTVHRLFDGVYGKWPQPQRPWGVRWVPYRGLLGPLLYLGVYGFNVAMTFVIGEYLLGIVDLFVMLPFWVLAWTQVARPSNRATAADLAAHCRDFPYSPLCALRYAGGNAREADDATSRV